MKAKEIFEQALEIGDEQARHQFVAAQCGSDAALNKRVLKLLDADRLPADMLDAPFVSPGQLEEGGLANDTELPLLKCPLCGQATLQVDSKCQSFVCTREECGGDFELKPSTEPVLARVSTFQIIGLLGEGGFGRVWFAKDEITGQYVALKIPRKQADKKQAEAFVRETRRAYKFLKDPRAADRIPQLCAAGEDNGLPYIAFEFLNAEPLSKALTTRQDRNPRWAANIVQQIAETLQIAHNNSVVHKDVKPSNILVTANDRVYVTDFGISKDLRLTGIETSESIQALSAAYSSPEHMNGGVDPRSDIFSLGIVLFELVSGEHPFPGDSAWQQLSRISDVEVKARDLREVKPGIDPQLARISSKCLEKIPENRPSSAGELSEDLRAFLTGQPSHSAIHSGAKDIRPSRETRSTNLGRVLLAFAAAAALLGSVWGAIHWGLNSAVENPANDAISGGAGGIDSTSDSSVSDGTRQLKANYLNGSANRLLLAKEHFSTLKLQEANQLSEEAYQWLRQRDGLRRLEVEESEINKSTLSELAELANLEELAIQNVGTHESFTFTYPIYQFVSSASRIGSGTAGIPVVTADLRDFKEAGGASVDWKSVVIQGQSIDDMKLKELLDNHPAWFAEATEIRLFQTAITAGSLLDFSGSHNLKRFGLEYATMGSELEHLRLPEGLETLFLRNLSAGEESRRALSRIEMPTALERLDITDFGEWSAGELSWLPRLQNLERLDIFHVKIDAELVALMNQLESLTEVFLVQLSEEQHRVLQENGAKFSILVKPIGEKVYVPEP